MIFPTAPGMAVCSLSLILSGCLYRGSACSFDPGELDRDPGWIAIRDIQPVLQEMDSDCGAAALAMVLNYWDEHSTCRDILAACNSSPEGIRTVDLRDYARNVGLKAFVIQGEFPDFIKELSKRRPVIVGLLKGYWTGSLTHYEVVVGIHQGKNIVVTLDPAVGWRQNTFDGFSSEWSPFGNVTIVVFRSDPDTCRLDKPY